MPQKESRSPSTAAIAALALTLVGAVALGTLTPLSAPVAASSSLAFGAMASPAFPADGPVIGAFTASTSHAEAALDDSRAALTEATSVMAQSAESGLAPRIADSSIDTAALRAAISDLAKADVVPVLLFPELADDAEDEAREVRTRTTELRAALETARVQKAVEDAAAQAQREAEAAAAAAQAAADTLAAANTPEGAKSAARQMAADRYGWGGDQFSCLASLWQKESGWNYRAYNASSGATGIPQALPGSKMSSAGADWASNAATQIAWGLQYISSAYGSPCGAWGKSQSSGWY